MDVNEQFAQQRTSGYDRSEYVGKDGLDTTLGHAALFTRVPAWHGLGYVADPDREYTVADIMRHASIDFRVEKRRIRYSFGLDDPQAPHFHEFEGRYVLVRDDTAAPLGLCTDAYEIFQTHSVFGFMEELIGADQLIVDSAGALRGGSKVFISGRIPQNLIIDPEGAHDEVVLFLGAVNDFTGKGAYWTGLTPWRFVCANTVRFGIKDAPYKWKIHHTKNGLDRVEEARQSLNLTYRYAEAFVVEETQLAQTDLFIDQFHELVKDLWPVPEDASDKARANITDRHDQLVAAFESEDKTIENCRGTAYGAENVISRYLDWFTDVGTSNKVEGGAEVVRATRLMEGYGDEIKTRAHKLLMRKASL